MASETRQIVVDDTDLNIRYSGPWFKANGTHNNQGEGGNPFKNTLHGVNANASFSSSFRGSQLTVFGSFDGATTSDGGAPDPTWTCFIDGHSISTGEIPVLPQNNWELCENTAMSDAVHNLTLQVTVMNSSNTFWFDTLQYIPTSTANAPVNNVTVAVMYSDPSIQYDPGWGLNFPILIVAGVQITWFGFIQMFTSVSLPPASATYSIDGDSPVSFPLPKPVLPYSISNQIIFQTAQLSLGKHILEVIYGGNSSTAPLSLQSFIIRNATIVATSANNTSGAGPTDLPSNSIPKGKLKSQIGPIIGGVLGGVMIIALLISLLHRQSSRRRPKIEPYKTLDVTTPLPTTVQPFDAPERELTTTEKRPPFNRISIRPIYIQTTGKVVRNDGIPETIGVASAPDQDTAPIQNGSLTVQTVRHEDSGLRLPESEDDLVVELPPLYTAG